MKPVFNPIKLLAPDFWLGRLLVGLRGLLDSAILLLREPSQESLRLALLIQRIKPRYTMVSNPNLVNLYRLVGQLDRTGIAGDIVECGVWNGGSAAMMAAAHSVYGIRSPRRRIWLFDSFQGLPPPGAYDGAQEQQHYFAGLNRGAPAMVTRAFQQLGAPTTTLQIVPGWFDQTLPGTAVQQIALLHIDADWYDSVLTVLDTLYDRVVPGGFVQLDDYAYWEGCARAVHDFLNRRGLPLQVQRVGRYGAFFRKPVNSPVEQHV